MLRRVRDVGDIDHVIVYKLSRMARNRVDDALVMADLRQRGVTLISATESVDDTPVGQLTHGILATFNEYQSRESGADIAYKMGQKSGNGGTRPYRPQTNGKVERFNRTLLDEWAYAHPYRTETERRDAYPGWIHTSNHHRDHTALDGKPPTTRVPNLTGQYT